MHAGDHDIELTEQVVPLIERAVLEDVNLDAGRMRNGASWAFSRLTSSSCAHSSSADSPEATVSRGEWSVSAIHS